MTEILPQYLPWVLGAAGVAYLVLAARVSRSSENSTNVEGFFLFFIGVWIVGAAFSYAARDPQIYGVGRTLTFIGAGFIPLAFYSIYREYTVGAPNALLLALLAIVPIASVGLTMTNPLHNIMWMVVETPQGIRFSELTEHWWYKRVHAPFSYGLMAFTFLALIGRLPTIAPAHRGTIVVMLAAVAVPFGVAFGNTFLGIGPPDFPFTASTLAVMLPLMAYLSFKLRVYDFSPLAYKTLFDHVRDPIIVLDNDQVIICANRAAEAFLGESEYQLIGRKLWQEFPKAREVLQQARELDLTQTLKFNKNQTFEVSVGPLTGPRGQNLGMVVACRDVTERRLALSQLAESEHLVRTLIETSSNGILRFSRENDVAGKFRCIFANRAADSYLGNTRGTLVGMPLEKLDQLEPEKLLTHFENEETKGSSVSFEAANESVDGEVWLRIVAEPVGEDFSVTVIDITQRKRNEDKMMADALRDPLTGVLNRRGFEKEGVACIRKFDRGAILYLDLNGFKTINDRFGHQAGDALLKAFGHRLEFCLRPEDVLGRLGGDEFAIVLPGVSVDDAKHVAQRLVQTASEAYIIQGQEIGCTASVGIALMPKHGEELWHLVSVADQAMYDAKSIGVDEAANDCAAYIEAAVAS
ncbi:MAG: diguanylate cyclase [Gammaproteobacteria bacterium]|nr:diguanylate cyclase [Gammaproteobacteria bacterium]